ncbi:hypothetical protein CKAH01_09799 [Colletotrichum kahawae]|uniref:Uncharacterized protein n=1 Tax=Colletotrichum kahawae TaxID=34407 RepID=A0AAD9XXM0_COLKA|nr:hypothetical protein CKAH01_09799 [Colletotrichum kahawae]
MEIELVAAPRLEDKLMFLTMSPTHGSLDRLFESRFQAADAKPANDHPGAVSAFSSSCYSTNPWSVESVSAISLSPHLSRRPPTFPTAESLNSLCLRAPR